VGYVAMNGKRKKEKAASGGLAADAGAPLLGAYGLQSHYNPLSAVCQAPQLLRRQAEQARAAGDYAGCWAARRAYLLAQAQEYQRRVGSG